jgi:diguanylate cyclase (GGDEF)-like protein/PAS domain S-box-containing protein
MTLIRPSWPITVLAISGILLIVAIAIGAATAVGHFRDSALANSERELKNIALTVAQHVNHELEELEQIEKLIVEQITAPAIVSNDGYQRQVSGRDIHLMIRDRIAGLSHISAIGIIDSNGKLINSTRSWPVSTFQVDDRDYFIALKSDPKLDSFLSEPMHSRGNGAWSVVLARRLNAQNGDFLGVLAGTIELSYFERFFSSILLADGSSLGISRRDGVLLERYPRIESMIGNTYRYVIDAMGEHDEGTIRLVAPFDGKERMLIARRVRNFPLNVAAGIEIEAALSDWRKQTRSLLAITAISVLVIGIVFFLIVRQLTREHRDSQRELALEKLRLKTAINNMAQGLLMFDSQERIVLTNNRYIDMYGLSSNVVKYGCTFRELMHHRKEIRSFNGDIEEYRVSLLRDLAQEKATDLTIETPDGRFIRIVNQPMEGGGWVATHEDVTDKIRFERQLKLQKDQLDAALTNMSQGVCIFDSKKRLVLCNERYSLFYRVPAELTKPGISHQVILAHRASQGIFKGGENREGLSPISESARYVDKLADGKIISVTREPMPDGGWVALHEDITEQRRAEEERDRIREFLTVIVDNAPVPIFVKDAIANRYILVNRASEGFWGVARAEMIGKTPREVFTSHEADRIAERDAQLINAGQACIEERQVCTPNNGNRDIISRRIAINNAEGSPLYIIGVIEDITERKRTEARIAHLAHHDVLTGLANRVAFTIKIEEAAARQRRWGMAFNILMLDLDRFKDVNDAHGHPVGDVLLKQVAARLASSLRETDTLARLGGDEFAIIQAGEAGAENAKTLANRIVELLTTSFDIDGKELAIGTSVGIALAPDHGLEASELLKRADLALYRVKANGGNDFCLFANEMGEAASTRHLLENDLRRAIARNDFELYYQPIVSASTYQPCGAEALIRWRHPDKGMIGPDQFIPVAEATGLINRIGEWVLETACRKAATWPSFTKVAINLSALQFRKSNLVDVVICALAESGLPPERLEFELTESALFDNPGDCLSMMRQFRNLGIAVVLDDFGTGHSSLSQLTMFPIDKIKIDKSFTAQLTKRADCAAIISAVLTLAKGLDITTTAEGVETADQARLLKMAGVTTLQGYLFGKPGPASQIDFLRACRIPEVGNAA